MRKPKHSTRAGKSRFLRLGTALVLTATAGAAGLAAAAPTAHAEPTGTGPWEITTVDGIVITTNINAVGDGFGVSKKWICHPVAGDGELKNGWNLIDPADPSVHIDEAKFEAGISPYGKHDQDGRTDVYATLLTTEDPKHVKSGLLACPGTTPPEHLTVDQTITTSSTAHIPWTLTKTADKDDSYLYSPHSGGATSDTIHWTVTATAQAPVENNDYAVSGSVVVTNDGGNDTTFDMAVDLPSASAVDCGDGTATADVAVGSSVTCTWSASPASKITDTVTATATTAEGTYSDADAISWAPASTITSGQTATLADASQGYSEVVNADDSPIVVPFSTVVNWADLPCGNSVVSNTATLSTVADPASDSVNVHRQCESFNTDTAWASTAAGANRYLNASQWATYVARPATSATYNIYAGQTKLAGTVTINNAGAFTINLTNGFSFASGTQNLHIATYDAAPKGNPSPGQFPYKKTCSGTTCSGTVSAYVKATTKYFGIHLAVGQWVVQTPFGP